MGIGWSSLRSRRRLAVALVPLAPFALPPSRLAAQGTAPYTELDRVEGEVDFNAVPRRPMALSDDQLHLYAVNTHASTVLHFTEPGEPDDVFRVPKSPVSIAVWDDPGHASPHKLVVVCSGTYAVVVLDAATGTILDLIETRNPDLGGRNEILGEPSDLLVDEANDTAFVSCAAADAVLEIDLAAGAPVHRYALPAKFPVFLCFDANQDVLVAPMLSGNNSGARQLADVGPNNPFNAQHQGPTVVDFATQALNGTRLPDHDLFRCVRSNRTVEPLTTGVGTVLFAFGVHPTGNVWQLATEANNKNASAQTEASIRGNIVQNRLAIVNVSSGSAPHSPTTIRDLDLSATGAYDDARAVGQPYGLTFVGPLAAVTGLLTDNVMVLKLGGQFVAEFDLPAGSIPRGSVHAPLYNWLFVYCWGTSKIEAYLFSKDDGYPHQGTFDLGYDPTPAAVRRGREIFYDASHSERNNASCASCHVEGHSDLVVWNLSKGPTDDKGPMLTQTLAGIEKLLPFHWRGEQQNGLVDFNPAFVGLLGANEPLSSGDFADFERFVFSIQNRPNPFQNEERVLDDAIQPPLIDAQPASPASAVAGQGLFVTSGCIACHDLPLGTNNDIIPDGIDALRRKERNPRRQYFKTPSFLDLYRREQDADRTQDAIQAVTIDLPKLNGSGGVDESSYSLLGAAVSHAGLLSSINEFMHSFPFLEGQQSAEDITSLLFQWDQGVAPAAYRGVRLVASNAAAVAGLVQQAEARNCDVAAFGKVDLGSGAQPMRWVYDTVQDSFVPEVAALAARPLSFFPQDGSNVFVGLPVGSGRRFAIDFDGDDVLNGDEPGTEDDPALPSLPPDTVAPVASAQVGTITTRVARIHVETNEPCTVLVTYTPTGGAPRTKSTTERARVQSIVLNDLAKATTYAVTVEARDRGGNTDTESLQFVTDAGNGSSSIAVISSLTWDSVVLGATPGGGPTLSARANVVVKHTGASGGPMAGVQVIGRVFVDGVLDSTFTAPSPSTKLADFDFLVPALGGGTVPTDFTTLGGPFVLSPPTSASGATQLRFALSGFSADVATLNVELVVTEATGHPSFTVENVSTWNMPATPAPFRALSINL